ncbi:MAG: class I SAM-dependent methyltransferase [Chrysiogenia bacterium]
MPELNEKLIPLLRAPNDLQQLKLVNGLEFQAPDGKKFPVSEGVVVLLPEAERGADLGDGKFYEENPFGLRDWSNPDEVESGVEQDLKALLDRMPKDALIADVGAGTGRISNFMSMKGYTNVASIDYSLASLRMIHKNSKNLCIWGNNLHLPLANDAFDLVISTGVIHHTPDPKKALVECTRVVKPGGLFYLKLRNIHSPYGYLFYTYGAVLRFFERHRSLRFLSTIFGFGVYKLTRKILYRHLPAREDKLLRGKYENLFIKKLITFFTSGQVKKMLKENNMEIQYGRKVGFSHRQHFYVSRKTGDRR